MPNSNEKKISVLRYEASHGADWNRHIAAARNGSFLFRRDYMEYHSDRFRDHSVMVFESTRLVACLPASESEKEIRSHGGLTYGGLVVADDAKIADVMAYFDAVIGYFRQAGFNQLRYAKMPGFFGVSPCDEDEYFLTSVGASLARQDVFFIVDRTATPNLDKRRRQGAKKGEKVGLTSRSTADFSLFWSQVLESTLQARHHAKPVHSHQEIELLAKRFPENIRLVSVWEGEQMIAGTVLFLTANAVHTQYIASSERGQEVAALDWLFVKLLAEYESGLRYFSFGTSRDPETGTLNLGLTNWKESFGARSWTARTYTLKLD